MIFVVSINAEEPEEIFKNANEQRTQNKPWKDKFEFHGDLWAYNVFHNNVYYSDSSESIFTEPTARLQTNIHLTELMDINLRGVLNAVAGDSRELTSADNEAEFVMDLWNFEARNLLDKQLSIKIGRQEMVFGDGFLIWDGVTDNVGAWSTPLRSFYAAKLNYKNGPFIVDVFSALTEGDFVVYDGFAQGYRGRSRLYGANVHLEGEHNGIWDTGVYYRDDTSDLENDTLAISLRGEYTVPFLPFLTLSGEVVKEYGDTKLSGGTLSQNTQRRDSWGWHFDAALSFDKIKFSPYVKGRYINLGGDDPDTSEIEAHDPLFYGLVDWDKWWIGSIASWELLTSNEKVWTLEVGVKPTEKTQLRILLFDFRLDEKIPDVSGREWSQEANIIVDWYPNEKLYYGGAINYSHPEKAAESFNGDNEDILELVFWAGVSF